MLLQFVQQLVNGITISMIYTLMAVGLTVIFGILRVGNFAQGEFYMLGAFVAFFMALASRRTVRPIASISLRRSLSRPARAGFR